MKWYVIIAELIYVALACFLCDINATETYTWASGIWHGIFFPIRWIISLVSDGFLYQAVKYTAGYEALFVVFAILSTIIFFAVEIYRFYLVTKKD